MPSVIGWLDQSEEQQRKMREVISLFAESGTIDDIGIGVVRDAFSDLLFPGLSTVQTRVRYFLFVPWVYQRLEAERVTSERAEERARRWELDLIKALLAGGATDGVIGREAGEKLKQLPSLIYWNGLRRHGIRDFNGTRRDYHRQLSRIVAGERNSTRSQADESQPTRAGRWHSNLPQPPSEVWSNATLDLTQEEAEYLQERFATSAPESLLGHLARSPREIAAEMQAPWDAVTDEDLGPTLTERLRYAQFFSETILGAQLLYNLMLAEMSAARDLAEGEARQALFAERLAEWKSLIEERRPWHQAVSRVDFWRVVMDSGATVSGRARSFINAWLDLIDQGVDVESSTAAREMIRQRERTLKRGLAKLSNPRALENWGGSAGAGQLTYRWAEGRLAISDLAAGLGVANA